MSEQRPTGAGASQDRALAVARRAAARPKRLRRSVGVMCAVAFVAIIGIPALYPSPRPDWVPSAAIALAYLPVLIALPRVSMNRWSLVPMLVIPFANVAMVYRIGYRACILPARDWPPLGSERDRMLAVADDFYILT